MLTGFALAEVCAHRVLLFYYVSYQYSFHRYLGPMHCVSKNCILPTLDSASVLNVKLIVNQICCNCMHVTYL